MRTLRHELELELVQNTHTWLGVGTRQIHAFSLWAEIERDPDGFETSRFLWLLCGWTPPAPVCFRTGERASCAKSPV